MSPTQRWVLVLAAVASLMAALDTLVVAAALSTIQRDLGASIEDLEWTVNAYNLSFAVLLMTAAAAGDRLGRRRMFAAGLALFTVASAACALAGSVGVLVAARVAQGAGAALIMTLSLALVGDVFPPERRGLAMGLLQGITGLSVASGPLVGGAVAEGMAWQAIFWLNLPIGVVAVPLALRRLPESFGPGGAFDVRGLLLVTAGTSGVVWGLVRGNAAGWSSTEVAGSLAAGVVLLAAFAAWEARAPHPMLPLRFFRSRAFSAGNVAIFCTFASLYTAVFFFAQFLQVTLGYGPFATGVRLLPWTVTLFVCAPIAGALTDRIGERPLLVTGLVLQAMGMAWIALVASADMSYADMVAPLVVAGCGVSTAMPSVQSSVVSAVRREDIGRAAGANSMMRQLGGVFGIAVAVAVFAAYGSFASPVSFADGFTPAIVLSAAFSLAGALAGLWLPGRRTPSSAHAAPEPVVTTTS
jgi:EmrB/QacA subfamily drug resistance transporter